jgi:hypothetical protein
MKALAEALVESAAFLELSGNEVISPDAAVRALESITATLDKASENEKKALLDYCREQATTLRGAQTDQDRKRRDFYLGFEEAFGLIDE